MNKELIEKIETKILRVVLRVNSHYKLCGCLFKSYFHDFNIFGLRPLMVLEQKQNVRKRMSQTVPTDKKTQSSSSLIKQATIRDTVAFFVCKFSF